METLGLIADSAARQVAPLVPAGKTILGMSEGLFYGGIFALVGIAVAIYLFAKTASKKQAKSIEGKVDALTTKFGRFTAYLDGLPKATGPVRTSFDAGYAAYKACKWDEAIGHFREAIKTAS
ncbi:hypothetical protein FJY71_08510, partial [candidate division WOR-3 bacterium]|nr:hypothetical protein [candidate division WOR-3 bacterium]